jgi:hypothetical protein
MVKNTSNLCVRLFCFLTETEPGVKPRFLDFFDRVFDGRTEFSRVAGAPVPDIGVMIDGAAVALRPVKVYSEDYAVQEYTPESPYGG